MFRLDLMNNSFIVYSPDLDGLKEEVKNLKEQELQIGKVKMFKKKKLHARNFKNRQSMTTCA